VQDITARHQDEQLLRESQSQLRALADRLIAAREEEARRIARELHDEMGQYLTALKLDATWLRQRMNICCEAGLGVDLNERLDRMLRLIDTTIERSRKICTELRSGVLDELGLVAALEWQAQEFEERTNIFCSLSLPIADPPLDYQRATTVFRIFQEVLTNIARHADATEVDVRLEMAGELMTLRVSDNGRGISKSEIAGATGLGLLGMRERALGAGGSVSICGEPGQGTIVVLQLPTNSQISS
ncbi:MAG: sensor histidine kinase, partial [Verrucomicrobiota bacterium]